MTHDKKEIGLAHKEPKMVESTQKLEAKIASLEAEKQALNELNNMLQQEYQKRNNALSSELTECQQNFQNLESDFSALRTIVETLQLEKNDLEKQLQMMQAKSTIAKQDSGLKENEKLVNTLKDQIEELTDDLSRKEKEIKLLKSNRESLQSQILEMEGVVESLERDNKKLRKELADKKNENLTLVSDISELQEKIAGGDIQVKQKDTTEESSLQKTLEEALMKNETLTKELDAQKQELEKVVLKYAGSLREYEEETKNLQAVNQELSQKLQIQDQIISQQKEQLASRENLISQQTDDVSASARKIHEQLKQIEELQMKVRSQAAELQKARQELVQNEQIINQQANQLTELSLIKQNQAIELQTQAEQLNTPIQQIETLQRELKEQEKSANDQNELIVNLKEINVSQAKILQEQLEQKKKSAKEYQLALDEKAELAKQLAAKDKEIQALNAKISVYDIEQTQLKIHFDELQTECESFRRTDEEHLSTIKSLQADLFKHQSQANTMLAQNHDLQIQIKLLEAQHEVLKAVKDSEQQKLETNDESESEKAADKKASELQSAFEISQAELERANSKIEHMQEEINNLVMYNKQVEKLNNETKISSAQSQKALEEKLLQGNQKIEQVTEQNSQYKAELQTLKEAFEDYKKTHEESKKSKTESDDFRIEAYKEIIAQKDQEFAELEQKRRANQTEYIQEKQSLLARISEMEDSLEEEKRRFEGFNEKVKNELVVIFKEDLLPKVTFEFKDEDPESCFKAIKLIHEHLTREMASKFDDALLLPEEKELETLRKKVAALEKEKAERAANWKKLCQRIEDSLGGAFGMSFDKDDKEIQLHPEQSEEKAFQELIVSRIEKIGEIFEQYEQQLKRQLMSQNHQEGQEEDEHNATGTFGSIHEEEVKETLVIFAD